MGKLRGKDIITIGIFTALYFVLSFVSNIAGGIHPLVWIMSPVIAGILGAVPFMIMVTKVKKPFAVLLMGTIVGLLYFATGQFAFTVPLFFITGSIIVEVIRYKIGYDSFIASSIGFAIFSLGMAGSPLPVWLYKESFIEQIRSFGMQESYVTSLENLTTLPVLIAMIALTLIAGLVGAYISKKLFKKHFKKAGIV